MGVHPQVSAGQRATALSGAAGASMGIGRDADLPRTHIDPDSIRGRIVSAYLHAVQFLESRQSVVFQQYFTLRDFLTAVRSKVTAGFVDLTSLAERALYGPDEPTDEDAHQADVLDAAVQRDHGEERT